MRGSLPCPECGAKMLTKIQGDCRLLDGTLVRHLSYCHCSNCGADLFDRAAMQEIRKQRGEPVAT